MILFLKLVVAHLVGDFLLQSNAWVKDKERKKWRSGTLLLHVLLHGLLLFLVLLTESIRQYWWIIPIIMGTHWGIDALKLQFQGTKYKTRMWWFIGDQVAHILVIAGIWNWIYPTFNILDYLNSQTVWGAIGCILLLTQPAAIFVKVLISGWAPEEHEGESSLANAGKYIGILERLFVFGFVVNGNWEGIGFLLAAKSVFRFGDLNKSKERRLTEYVLIGTLISFGIAILTGLIFNALT